MYGYEIFHEKIMTSLIASVRKGHAQHAYIFEGESGIGKEKAAKLFAASLVCSDSDRAPCGICPACIGAKADTNPDIRYITPGDKKSIGVDVMRDIVSDAYVRPFESTKKVYIIENGDIITEQAQNAFLKILEEPPEYTVFILMISNTSMLLQTIISRCTVLRFTPVEKRVVREYIKNNYPDADSDFLANYAEGNPGRADEAMAREDFFELRRMSFKMLTPLLSKRKISAYQTVEFLEEHADCFLEIVEFWQSMVRDIIFIQNDAQKAIINSDMASELSAIASKAPPKLAFVAEKHLQKAADMKRRNVAFRALILNLALSIKKEAYE